MNIFEAAARQKLRFETTRGSITVEDLWDLPLTSTTGKVNLDALAISLHQYLRSASDVVSFVDTAVAQDRTVQLKFDIVKHVIEERKKENAEAASAKTRAEMKQQLLAALARKRENALESATEEELLAKLAQL